MKRTLLKTAAIVCILAIAPCARAAETPADLAKDVKAKARSGLDPVSALLETFAEASDFRFDQQQVKDLAGLLGCPNTGMVKMLLDDVQRFEKRDGRITIKKRKGGVVGIGEPNPQGYLHYDDTMRFRIRKDGSRVKVDDFDGLEVSEKRNSTKASLRHMELSKNDEKEQILKVTAGIFIFTKTIEVNLTEMFKGVPNPFAGPESAGPPATEEQPAGSPAAGSTSGLTGGLGEVGGAREPEGR